MFTKLLKAIFGLGLIVFALLVGIFNDAKISLTFLDYQTPELYVFIWLFVALSMGIVIGLMGYRLFFERK